jgi:enoyl-CoA hydratase/carnithine racemase
VLEEPTVTSLALNGPALGAGLAFAASCGTPVAAEEACTGLPEIDVGLLFGI